MNHITQLSEKSRNFILKVSPNKVTCLALAKAIANTLALPTFEVANKNTHYIEKCATQARDFLSDVNEMCVFNTRQLEEMIKEMWMLRYSCAYPPKFITGATSPVFAFMGVHTALSKDTQESITALTGDITGLLNGFTLLLEEIKEIHKGVN